MKADCTIAIGESGVTLYSGGIKILEAVRQGDSIALRCWDMSRLQPRSHVLHFMQEYFPALAAGRPLPHKRGAVYMQNGVKYEIV